MGKRTLDVETIKRLRQHVIVIHDVDNDLWTIEVSSSQTRIQMRKTGPDSWAVTYSDLYPHAPLYKPLKDLLIEAAEAELSEYSMVH